MSYSNLLTPRKEQGATLISALAILLVITMIGISAARMSIIDTKVASNSEQQMMLYQEAENALKTITHPEKLYTWMEAQKNGGVGIADIITSKIKAKTDIRALNRDYACIGSGGAVSIGPEVPSCELYDFHIDISKKGLGTNETHHRGAGKEVPHNGGSY